MTEVRVATGSRRVAESALAENIRAYRRFELRFVCGGMHVQPNRCVKRSFRRACRRALLSGTTFYRGKCLTRQQVLRDRSFSAGGQGQRASGAEQAVRKVFDTDSIANSQAARVFAQDAQGQPFGAPDVRTQKPRGRAGQHHRLPRIKCFSWNVGGLSTGRLDHLLAWFDSEKVMIATLQETRWTFDSEWVSGCYVLIHSCGLKQDRFCGVLTIIHSSLCAASLIRHAVVLPGRILHVRACHPKSSQSIDIINCYQFFRGTKYSEDHDRADQQTSFLDKLGQLLEGIPRRNLLYVTGDFNMALPRTLPLLGPACTVQLEDLNELQAQFLQLVLSNGLCATNSWGATTSYTSIGPKGGHSLIDYLFLRKDHVDNEAKRVQFLYSHPHSTAADACHIPLLCSWSLAWSPWKSFPPKPVPLRMTLASATVAEQQSCERALAQALERVTALEDLPRVVSGIVAQFHCVPSSAASQPVWQESSSASMFVKIWKLHRDLALPAGASIHAVVRRWRIFASLMKARRAQHAHSKHRRKARMEELFTRARTAATKGDKRELHKLVRLLSPKQPRKHLQLRHPDGRVMELQDEVAAIQQQLMQQFASTEPTLHEQPVQLIEMPFQCDDIVAAIKNLSTYKAVPPGYVPTELWKRYAQCIGEKLWHLLSASWLTTSVSVPASWSASWLCLIPKAHKKQDQMSGWRPISLQDPCGKAVLSILAKKASFQCNPLLCTQPQFAYMKGRSTGDAIRRVAAHIALSQHYFSLAQTTLHDMRAGHMKLTLGGGMQVFLDVEHAFDAVPRSMLALALRRQPLNHDLIHLFLSWYSSTAYHYHHHGEVISVKATTGVRQGCVAAPLLWNCHTCNVMLDLQHELGSRWIRDVLTLFADDFHLQWAIGDETDFLRACRQLELFLRILSQMQVQVRAEKSSLMLLLGGRSARSLVPKRICRRAGQKFFKVRDEKQAKTHGQLLIPIVKTQKYLGIMVNYKHMQASTLGYRVRQSWATFHKLRKWWLPSALPLLRRMELWKVYCLAYPLLWAPRSRTVSFWGTTASSLCYEATPNPGQIPLSCNKRVEHGLVTASSVASPCGLSHHTSLSAVVDTIRVASRSST